MKRRADVPADWVRLSTYYPLAVAAFASWQTDRKATFYPLFARHRSDRP